MRLACVLARGDHAARCPRCRADVAHDRAIRALADAAPPAGLSSRARDAAFARALAGPGVVPARPARRWLVPAGVALAAAAAAVVIVVATRGEDGAPTPPATRPIAAGTTTAVGHGRVALSADGVGWQTGPTEVYLLTGKVEVEVDPAPHRPFRVRTDELVVDVLGTVFAVDATGVAVTRGAVRVSRPTGEVVVERLAAGQRWDSSAQTAAAPDPAPPVEDEPDEIVMDTEAAGSPPPRDLAKQVDAARILLSGKDIAGARRKLTEVLAGKPRRRVRVQAEILLADSYKNEGDLDEAVRRYRAIADRYRDLGEYPLGAAAEIERKRGRTAAARALYERYLERYPDGAIADAARRAVGTR